MLLANTIKLPKEVLLREQVLVNGQLLLEKGLINGIACGLVLLLKSQLQELLNQMVALDHPLVRRKRELKPQLQLQLLRHVDSEVRLGIERGLLLVYTEGRFQGPLRRALNHLDINRVVLRRSHAQKRGIATVLRNVALAHLVIFG